MTRATSGADHRILVIDDHPAIRRSLVEFLRSAGQVETACGGEEGLALADRFRPNAILVDWHMPVMDGAEFVRRYRRAQDSAAIILLSADPAVDDIAAELGVVALQKGTDPRGLSDCVVRLLRPQPEGAAGMRETASRL